MTGRPFSIRRWVTFVVVAEGTGFVVPTAAFAIAWVPLDMAAWLVGLVFTFLPSIAIDEHTPPALVAALFIVAGVAMATTVAVITGFGLRRMIRRHGERQAADQLQLA